MSSILTRRAVLLCWATAEAISPRWREHYDGRLSRATRRALKRTAATPGRLPVPVQDELIHLLSERRHKFIAHYVKPAVRYRYVEIPAARIGDLVLSPGLSWKREKVTLADYQRGVYSPETWHDPRNAAKRMLESPDPVAYRGYPIVGYDTTIPSYVLIEGYCRCLTRMLRMARGEDVPGIKAIVCEAADPLFAL